MIIGEKESKYYYLLLSREIKYELEESRE